jgi:hypothetical protein
MLKFKEYLLLSELNTVGKHNDYATGVIAPSVATGSEVPGTTNYWGHPPYLSSTDMITKGVPTKEVKGKIEMLLTKRDPCYLRLSDGTQLWVPHDALQKRFVGVPKVGRKMSITFQRRAQDNSQVRSQIAWGVVY